MRLIALLSVLIAVFAAFGLFPAEFSFAGIPLPVLASLVAAIAMAYAVTFLADV